MRDSKKKTFGRETVIVALICLLCLSAIAVGNHFLGGKKDKDAENNEEIINLNSEKKEDTTKQNNLQVDGNVVKESEANESKINEKKDNEPTSQEKNNSLKKDDINMENINKDVLEGNNKTTKETTAKLSETKEDNEENNVVNVNSSASNINFSEDEKIEWPVEGNVLLDYSMENTIYFPTLDTYKCNPALIIQSEKGTEVKAGVKGVVKEVSTEDEIGNYVVVEIGNGYELTYGQLSDIKVSKGNEIKTDTCIGLIADTSRYYANEGTNLYFKMTKNGEPCDPMDYLK